VAPDTISTMPEKTLHAFAEHGQVKGALPTDGGDAEDVLAQFTREGVNEETLAADLQREGTQAFDKSWNDLLACLASKSALVTKRPDQAGTSVPTQ
jgi:transaldolase